MSPDYPADADGDALRRVAASGNDMSQPMTIDFSIAAPHEAAARAVAAATEALGFDPSIYQDPDKGTWSVTCSKSMLATYAGVLAAQAQLAQVARAHASACEGWGSFGNCA